MIENPNSQTDPQTAEGHLASMDSREIHAVDAPTGPNSDPAYDGWGGCYAGDGSGMDDLADLGAQESWEDSQAEMDCGNEDDWLDSQADHCDDY